MHLAIKMKRRESSSVASPICQERQSERTFPIFAFSSRFPRSFSRFWQIFRYARGGHSAPPWHPQSYQISATWSSTILWSSVFLMVILDWRYSGAEPRARIIMIHTYLICHVCYVMILWILYRTEWETSTPAAAKWKWPNE